MHIRLAATRSVLQSAALFSAGCTLIVLLITCAPCFASLETVPGWPARGLMVSASASDELCNFSQLHCLPADRAREVFKHSTDSASLLLYLKFFFRFGFGVLCGWRHNGGMISRFYGDFIIEVTWPWAQTQMAIFGWIIFWILGHHPCL